MTQCCSLEEGVCSGVARADLWPAYTRCRWSLIGGTVLAVIAKSGCCLIWALDALLSSELLPSLDVVQGALNIVPAWERSGILSGELLSFWRNVPPWEESACLRVFGRQHSRR